MPLPNAVISLVISSTLKEKSSDRSNNIVNVITLLFSNAVTSCGLNKSDTSSTQKFK